MAELIDDALYSRQLYVLGDGAMQRMAKSSVLICGMGGLGVEIAKNVVLAGVKSLTIQDDRKASVADLNSQFFITEEDVARGAKRAEASRNRLADLNPYVSIEVRNDPLDMTSDLTYMAGYQCVILTECSLDLQLKVNAFCRQQSTIRFISADVFGVFASLFCDFGDDFEVVDTNGEECKDAFIHSISKENPGLVTCLENRMHGFETGDTVTFKEVKGMTALNGTQCNIRVVSPFAFTICDTSEFSEYTDGGICSQVKIPQRMSFNSLSTELNTPSLLLADLSKTESPANIHLGLCAMHSFASQSGRLPHAWSAEDADSLVLIAKEINQNSAEKVENVNESLLRNISLTCRGCLPPLCAVVGGIAAQETLKALTGKFSPLRQWVRARLCQVAAQHNLSSADDRYNPLRICVGDELCQQLANLRLFMVGCGAIGCEMLKNYALLGVASSPPGVITITDNDIIEKSNLNRQFLFRPHHIRQAKSTTAAASTTQINPGISIEAHQHKVGPQTEASVFTDAFFQQQHLVVNALDNLEARRYMDSRCVTNQRPLLESGTMGSKGHVQVIVPHLTESYSSQRDPPDEDIPYCTLKSFPAQIEHCIQWARDKFESSFSQKPALFNKFWSEHPDSDALIARLKGGQAVEGSFQTARIMRSRPLTWPDCVQMARLKFNKYFNHRAKQLLHAFPLDTKLQDGTAFWASPKRPPMPVEFDVSCTLHRDFVFACAKMYACVNNIDISPDDSSVESLSAILRSVNVPEFTPRNKKIVTDESAKKPEDEETGDDSDAVAAQHIEEASRRHGGQMSAMKPAEFEKDDDLNGHMDFITSASNLRAAMYNIEAVDRLKAKRIAGRIVPAIATTTAAVAGLVTVELLKILKQAPIEHLKNCFLNLALPTCIFSEPGPVEKTTLHNGVSFTIWDHWEIRGNKEMTLQQFILAIKEKYGLNVAIVVHKVKMIYVPLMPTHKKRLPQTMLKVIKPPANKKYVDLEIAYTPPGVDAEDEMGPSVRYHFGL
ncbi:hypothetical protein CAPTEDRAFT_224089 [Capitella teleta]|uniref:E1 ubiquitin-activating enzyme n=1 Tax=Capitella teleta TaxID=283909 RepID=R7U3Z5_CAPTE|nr:hypothetical protein CAPTEDRAFT_224089 [Capitella teleta]|eukprot:ELU01065.1 hypothetical protein CAPTEDRAFT_224089 [Capitella teleta]